MLNFFLLVVFKNILTIFLGNKKHLTNTSNSYSKRCNNDGTNFSKRNTTACTWRNKQILVYIVDYCDILIDCLAYLFSAIDFCDEKIFYFFILVSVIQLKKNLKKLLRILWSIFSKSCGENRLVKSVKILLLNIKSNQMHVFRKYLLWHLLSKILLISSGMYSTAKLSKYVTLLPSTYKTIQCVPIDLYSSRFFM